MLLNVLGCQLTYHFQGQAETNAEAWLNIALRPRKPEGSLGETKVSRFQGFIELFAPGGWKAKLHSHPTFLMYKYMSSTNK